MLTQPAKNAERDPAGQTGACPKQNQQAGIAINLNFNQSTIQLTTRIKKGTGIKHEEYAERYRSELALYDRAERYLKEHLGSDTKLRLKAWKAEVADSQRRKTADRAEK